MSSPDCTRCHINEERSPRPVLDAGVFSRVGTLLSTSLREGVQINVIRDQLGHASLAVTDRYLRDIAPADLIALGKSRTWTEAG